MKENRFIVLSKEDYSSVLPLDVVAFHYSAPGACGYHGVIRLITRDRRLYMINYLYDCWPKEDLFKVCPPYEYILTSYNEYRPLPFGWMHLNMGLGNSLFLTAELRQNIAVADMRPPEIYQQWDRLILDALDRTENQEPLNRELDEERVSPEWIDSLADNEVFVFGSNILGFHDGGASELALLKFGAIYGRAEGIQGQSYAIPTDGLAYPEIHTAISRFLDYAEIHPELKFLVTRIGCGTAGYDVSQIAPMFQRATYISNISLPLDFWKFLF